MLANGDIMFICSEDFVPTARGAVARIRELFKFDPLTRDDGSGQNEFCTWYDLARQYDGFLKVTELLCAAQERRRSEAPPTPPQFAPLAPVEPSELAHVLSLLEKQDLAPLLRRQSVCALLPGQKPQAVFHELYISIAGLQQAIAPGFDLSTNRWLFQYLTQALDKRMLVLVMRALEASRLTRFSLNLNVATLLSSEFLAFDIAVTPAARGTLVLELQAVDIFADLTAFAFARDFVRERGYRLCLDGLSHLSSGLIDRAKLDLDLIKVLWSTDMLDNPAGQGRDDLKAAIAAAGDARVILSRCDNEEAVRTGESLGIHLFQGHYIDSLIESAKKPC